MKPPSKSPRRHHTPRRRTAWLAALAVAALSSILALAACGGSEGEWRWREDPDAPVLGEGPFVEDAWRKDRSEIALQLAGASIPGERITSVEQNGSMLTVKTAQEASGMETMDLQAFGFRLHGGDVGDVETVVIDRPSGTAEALKAL